MCFVNLKCIYFRETFFPPERQGAFVNALITKELMSYHCDKNDRQSLYIHWPLETRRLGGVSVSYLAGRTCHKCLRYSFNEELSIMLSLESSISMYMHTCYILSFYHQILYKSWISRYKRTEQNLVDTQNTDGQKDNLGYKAKRKNMFISGRLVIWNRVVRSTFHFFFNLFYLRNKMLSTVK